MIVVVSETSPLPYLILIGQVDILPRLFDQVLVPTAVLAELSRPQAPEAARSWASSPSIGFAAREPARVAPTLTLGAGENAAIALALEALPARLLVDDRDAVRAARARGLSVSGTLALLDEAAARGLITDLSQTLQRLAVDTNFRVGKTTDQIIQNMLRRDQERKQAKATDPGLGSDLAP